MLTPLAQNEAEEDSKAQQEAPHVNALVATLELVLSTMKRKIVTSNKDLMGVVLFNTVSFPSTLSTSFPQR